METNTEAFDDYGFRAEEVSGRVRFQIDVSSLTVTGKSKNPFLAVRSRLVETLYAGMDEESAAVTCALLTGDTSGIESGLLENVRRGGIAHIFAVSGLHIGALYAFCLFLFRKIRQCQHLQETADQGGLSRPYRPHHSDQELALRSFLNIAVY